MDFKVFTIICINMRKKSLLSSGNYILVKDELLGNRMIFLSELFEKWDEIKRKKAKRKKHLNYVSTKNVKNRL